MKTVNAAVFHMAAQANIRQSIVDYVGDLENNRMAMMNILDGMLEHKVGHFLRVTFCGLRRGYGNADSRSLRAGVNISLRRVKARVRDIC
jgi:nucleoside-diphosphate-sugar epimerase